MRDHSPIPPPRVPKSGAPRSDPYGTMQPERYGRDADRRGPPLSGMARRRRSLSPPYRGREDKRHRRDDDYHRERQYSPRRRHSPDYGRGYDAGYDDGYYQQPPPPPKRAGGSADERSSKEPKTFKRFLMEDVPDSVTPLEAQRLYEQYLTGHFGDQLRARFEQEKTVDVVRAAYHPSAFESSLARHKEDAVTAAQQFAEDMREGCLDPASDTFNQGVQEATEATENGGSVGPTPAPEGPACLWKPDRVAADYKVAKRLVALVDHQRGLHLTDNQLLPKVDVADGGEQAADGEPEKDGGDPAMAPAKTPDATLKAVLAEIDSEDVAVDDEESLMSRLGHLDMLLTWLWRVHGIDYYGGKELLVEAEYVERQHMNRTVRGQRPEEGEEQDEDEAKADRDELAERVDKFWASRLEKPDPLLEGCKREEIESRLEDYVQSQIKMENDKKWGSTFSNKFFLEKRFVVKHVYNKHQQRLDEQRDVIRDDLYWLAYEQANKAKHTADRELSKQQEVQRAAAAVPPPSTGDVHMADAAAGDWHDGYEGDEGYVAAPSGATAGRGPGRLGPMRGRGLRSGMMGRSGRGLSGADGLAAAGLMGGLPMVDPTQMMMMGGLPGPIILPGPGMMPGMSGAMPLGAPMIIDPSMMAGDMGGMPMFIPSQGGRGLGMARGAGMTGRSRGGGRGGRGGFGGGMAAPPGTKLEAPGYLKHYYDLDAPANNRAVLDYGDL